MRHDITLKDGPYTLRPLSEPDFAPLMALAQANAAEYTHMAVDPGTPDFYLSGLDAPDQMVFVELVDGQYAGSTRYLDLRAAHFGLEIGSTWLAPGFMRSGANRAFKRLLMAHAFGALGMVRVQFKTDILNVRSQAAVAALGAVQEGVLRQHMLRPDGTMRDTVMYSVTRSEWPQVKAAMSRPSV